MVVDFREIAKVLEDAATAMERDKSLDPDEAVRLTVWGVRDAHVPQRPTTESDLYDEATSAIEVRCGWQECGIAGIPRKDAIQAARAEAARYRSYGGGRR